MNLSRRRWLAGVGGGILAGAIPTRSAAGPIRVGAIITEFTYRSHAHVILENFLEDYLFNGQRTSSGCRVVGMYLDQTPDKEMGREVAQAYGIPIYPTIEGALTAGGATLAVDAVLSIGEHGQYPFNEKGQHLYPRKEFFDQIVRTFEKTGQSAPVFNDKHLSYRWDWAREMYETAQRMGFALMAGSSVPLAQRRPDVEGMDGSDWDAVVSIHGGGVESYDFHALEVMQSLIESRRGGETGVASVQFLVGESLWRSEEQGLWSIDLADAAMRAELGPKTPTLRDLLKQEGFRSEPHGIHIRYRDGLSAMVLKVGDSATRWNFAGRTKEGRLSATSYYVGPWQNRNLFKALSHAIQIHFREKRSPYPVERTLLVSGILAEAMDSRFEGGVARKTPGLGIAYDARDFSRCRELGSSWTLITETTPEPPGIHRYFAG